MTTRSITDVAVWQCQMENQPSQAWNATHRSIAGGSMSGFVVASGDVAMGY